MLNIDFLLKNVPPLPSIKAKWVSIYLEPILGSGERLTIIVATITSTGNVLVKPAIRKEVVDAMYDAKAPSFNKMVEMIANSLEQHLKRTGEFHSWVAPVSGITLGIERAAASATTAGILRQAVSLSSSLSSLHDEAESIALKSDIGKDKWSTQLIDAVLSKEPRRQIFFNQNYSFEDGHRPAKIFYLSDTAAINTGKLFPQNLNTLVIDSKAKISDLSLIKKHGNFFERDSHEMLIFRPTDDDPAYSDKNIQTIHSAFLTLQDLADTYDVKIQPVYSIEEAASIILSTAA